MKRSILAAVALGAPLLLCLLLIGCGRPKDESDTAATDKPDTGGPAVAPTNTKKEPMEGKAGTVLHGKVTLKGSEPNVAALTKDLQDKIVAKPDQKTACFDMAPEAEKSQQYWVIDPATKGVGNVIVWIQPDSGHFFQVAPADNGKEWPATVEMTQPHCAFIPHVTWVVPTLVNPDAPADSKKNVLSGQKFTVSNTAEVSHNTKWTGNDTGLGLIPAHSTAAEVKLTGNNQLVHFECNIHPWMDAYVWVFNHPYVAKTNPDGTYEIKNVPVGKVRITAWHEKGPNNGYLTAAKIKGDDLELKDGDNVKDFELEVK